MDKPDTRMQLEVFLSSSLNDCTLKVKVGAISRGKATTCSWPLRLVCHRKPKPAKLMRLNQWSYHPTDVLIPLIITQTASRLSNSCSKRRSCPSSTPRRWREPMYVCFTNSYITPGRTSRCIDLLSICAGIVIKPVLF